MKQTNFRVEQLHYGEIIHSDWLKTHVISNIQLECRISALQSYAKKFVSHARNRLSEHFIFKVLRRRQNLYFRRSTEHERIGREGLDLRETIRSSFRSSSRGARRSCKTFSRFFVFLPMLLGRYGMTVWINWQVWLDLQYWSMLRSFFVAKSRFNSKIKQQKRYFQSKSTLFSHIFVIFYSIFVHIKQNQKSTCIYIIIFNANVTMHSS